MPTDVDMGPPVLSVAPPNAGPPHPLLLDFLAWLVTNPRTYGEVMDAWRTSFPRLSIWEDAIAADLVRIDGNSGDPID